MLPKKHRLSLTTQKKPLQKKGQKLSTAYFSLVFQPNQENTFKLATIIGLKISKLATTRNKLKRQLTAITKETLLPNTPINLIIIPKPTITKLSYQQLKLALKPLLLKSCQLLNLPNT